MNQALKFFRALSMGRTAAFLMLAGSATTAGAAPEEIQVYMDEMNKPGEFGLDIHNNYVPSGSREPDHSGGLVSRHTFRVTPEFSYGLSTNFELGAYVLSAQGPGGETRIDGEKIRVKFIAPKAEENPFFYGANLEIGRVDHRLDENPWNGELKGIFGYKGSRWTAALNANVDFKISGPAASPTSLEIDTKLAYKTNGGYQLGLESYNALGPFRQLGVLGQQSQTLYAVIDTSIHGWDLNFGIGRGYAGASDRWVLKAIVGVPFGT